MWMLLKEQLLDYERVRLIEDVIGFEEEEEDDWLSKCKFRGSLIFEKKEPIEVLDALFN